jgi:hypothetical protein
MSFKNVSFLKISLFLFIVPFPYTFGRQFHILRHKYPAFRPHQTKGANKCSLQTIHSSVHLVSKSVECSFVFFNGEKKENVVVTSNYLTTLFMLSHSDYTSMLVFTYDDSDPTETSVIRISVLNMGMILLKYS